MMEGDPDRELIVRAQKELPYGTSAYDALVRRYSSRVFGRSYRILRSEGDAEEAAQDVFLAVFRNLPRYRFEKPFSHWISTVTLNACRMILRRRTQEQRRRDAYAREPEPVVAAPETDVALRRIVLELLDELDPGVRVPMILRFVEGYTYSEVARELELSESAVKMRVSRGSKKLRELYESRTGERRGKRERDDG
jgi:RNA polymerase sigma-70 factor (ECF subfamily)